MLKLSVIVLTEKTGRLLMEAIASVKKADEILLIDTAAAPIAFEGLPANVRIVRFAQPVADFSSLRNWSMTQATHDWILFLDSDEKLIAPSINKIKRLISSCCPEKQGQQCPQFVVSRSDVFHGQILRGGEASQAKLVRLVNRQHSSFIKKVHEVAINQGRTIELPVQISHNAHRNVASFLEKVSKYAQLAAKENKDNHEPKFAIVCKMLLFPPAKFCYNMCFRRGIVDGMRGVTYASLMSLHSFLVRANQLSQYYDKKNL